MMSSGEDKTGFRYIPMTNYFHFFLIFAIDYFILFFENTAEN